MTPRACEDGKESLVGWYGEWEAGDEVSSGHADCKALGEREPIAESRLPEMQPLPLDQATTTTTSGSARHVYTTIGTMTVTVQVVTPAGTGPTAQIQIVVQ